MKLCHLARILALSASCLAAVPVTCNSIFAKRNPADDEYEYVTVLGSNVPQRIKKGTRLVPMSPIDGMTTDTLEKMQRNQPMPRLPVSGS